jgi:hypothetical protein
MHGLDRMDDNFTEDMFVAITNFNFPYKKEDEFLTFSKVVKEMSQMGESVIEAWYQELMDEEKTLWNSIIYTRRYQVGEMNLVRKKVTIKRNK